LGFHGEFGVPNRIFWKFGGSTNNLGFPIKLWGFHGEIGISKGKFGVSKGEFGVSKGKFGVSNRNFGNLGFPQIIWVFQ
jgi:hypothetical protein